MVSVQASVILSGLMYVGHCTSVSSIASTTLLVKAQGESQLTQYLVQRVLETW